MASQEGVALRYEDLSRELMSPDGFDQKRFRALMKEQSDLAPLVETYQAYKKAGNDVEDAQMLLEEESDEEMRALAKEELAAARQEVSELEERLRVLLLPKDPNDDKNVIVEIRAGAGGDEAALFAGKYTEYVPMPRDAAGVSKRSVLKKSESAVEIRQFLFQEKGPIQGLNTKEGVPGAARPVTESGGRIHTSTCTVAVIPEVGDDIQIDIPDKDVRIDVMRASGNGGQCVNTTDSAVRLTHYPTGIVIYSQTEKSQLQNKAKAWALLRSRLYDLEMQRRHDEEADLRRSQIGTGDRSEKIRTYNFPQGRVTDHRIKCTLYKLDSFLNGDMDDIIDPLIAADQAAKLMKLGESA